jgi:hypothetical protein
LQTCAHNPKHFIDTNTRIMAETHDDADFIDVSFDKDGGVLKKILRAAPEDAKGPPPKGNEVEAHYTGAFVYKRAG